VAGILTYKGQPVPNVYVDFVPEKGRMTSAVTDEQGHFEVEYDRKQKGISAGKNKVAVRPKPATRAEQEAEMMGKRLPLSKEKREFFAKYGEGRSKVELVIEQDVPDLRLDWN
jgi:hypothetical protein